MSVDPCRNSPVYCGYLPISWKGLLAHYAGRIHRQIEGKDKVVIYDYVDMILPILRMMLYCVFTLKANISIREISLIHLLSIEIIDV